MKKSDAPPVTQGNEPWITLGVLKAIEENNSISQRSIAKDVGIALGLANTYLKRCVKKGWIKVRQTPANRYAYYLTPRGFSEKGRLTAEYLSQSLKLFRLARREAAEIYETCATEGWTKIALIGTGDLAEIFALSVPEGTVSLSHFTGPEQMPGQLDGINEIDDLNMLRDFDAAIICDLRESQALYDAATGILPDERILVPGFLGISRKKAAKQKTGS